MLHYRLLPDVITYDVWISACKKGTLPQRALQHLETMMHQGLVPDMITDNAWIRPAAAESP